MKAKFFSLGLAALAGLATSFAGQPAVTTPEKSSDSLFSQWWNGKYASGNWLGVRDTLEDHGLILGAEYKANILFNVDGGLQQRGGYDDEFKFRGTLDFYKLTGWDALEGLTAYSDLRYRGGAGVNKYTGTSSQFAPSTFQGGRLWRFQNVYLTYTTPELFGIKEFFTISGGWQNPTDIFIRQPENKFFVNNTFNSNRGIGAESIGWGGSYAAWGGYAKVKPTDWSYLQSGLYMAIPDATNPANHGLYFEGASPSSRNGLFWLTELGVTPKIGPSKLPGHYAAGFIYWGVENQSYLGGGTNDERVLVYWQADQMLFREPSHEAAPAKAGSDGKSVADGKEAKETIAPHEGRS